MSTLSFQSDLNATEKQITHIQYLHRYRILQYSNTKNPTHMQRNTTEIDKIHQTQTILHK